MRLKIYKNEEELNFEDSLLIDPFINEKLDNKLNLIEIDFKQLDYLLKEQNKYYLELAFIHTKNDLRNG